MKIQKNVFSKEINLEDKAEMVARQTLLTQLLTELCDTAHAYCSEKKSKLFL